MASASNPSSLNWEDAQKLVKKTAAGNGYIGEDVRKLLPPDALEAMENLERIAGSAIGILGETLYSSKARFVLELIQNAEDNSYKLANARGMDPFISFKIYPSQIIVETNEDGFKKPHVSAICKVGESTKSGGQGYIGEKGIGFKSVFMVAREVWIQSPPFSFCFKHEKGKKGLGMITPIWKDIEDGSLPRPLTRMTLTLIEDLDRDELFRQFDELPDTLLLFLTQLKRLEICRYDDSGGIVSSANYTYREEQQGHRVILRKQTQNKKETTHKYYHITRLQVDNLPTDEHRNLRSAEVVLGFEINKKQQPVIAHQQFLIQSDFVTEASRQNAIETPRNEALLDYVAEAFQKAVVELCEHPSLQYSWLEFLPDSSVTGRFWNLLFPKIKDLLEQTPIVRSCSTSSLRCINELFPVPESLKDRYGNPLFADVKDELYLAPEYDQYQSKLRRLGLEDMNERHIIRLIGEDLASDTSRMKSDRTEDDWHTRVAKLLINIEKTDPTIGRPIRKLHLLPLENGEWVSPNSSSVFYPDDRGMRIPTDLGLNLLDPRAVQNPARKKLFDFVGAREPNSRKVRKSIFEKHEAVFGAPALRHSIMHLRYLYWTDERAPAPLRHGIYIYDTEGIHLYSSLYDFYVESDEPYSVQQLLKPTQGEVDVGSGVACFIHPQYLRDPPKREDYPSWRTWLASSVNLQTHLRLTDRQDPGKLSSLFVTLAQYRASRLAGLLRAHWNVYSTMMSNTIIDEIAQLEFPCIGGHTVKLQATWVPSPELQKSTQNHLGKANPSTPTDNPFRSIAAPVEQRSTGTAAFGGLSSGASTTNCQGTGKVSITAYVEKEYGSEMRNSFTSINFQAACKNFSPEELRLADYEQGRRRFSFNIINKSSQRAIIRPVQRGMFPFLKLPPETSDDSNQEWQFLHKFGVGLKKDQSFYLTLLGCIYNTHQWNQGELNAEKICHLYEDIQNECWGSDDGAVQNRTTVRTFFSQTPALVVPPESHPSAHWADLNKSLWDAPHYMKSMYSLKQKYEAICDKEHINLRTMKEFIQETLGIPNVKLEHLIGELQLLRTWRVKVEQDDIQDLYHQIDSKKRLKESSHIRDKFESEQLVYVRKDNSWHSPSGCLWSSVASIAGKVNINEEYPELEDFFLNCLEVKAPTVGMIIDELDSACSNGLTKEITRLIWALNSIISGEEESQGDPEDLVHYKFLPVRLASGQVDHQYPTDDFLVIDRQTLGHYFKSKVSFLDFELEDVKKLEPLLSWLDLEGQYISSRANEVSKLNGGSSQLNAELTQRLRHRAHALVRCAVDFQVTERSPNSNETLYHLLRSCEVNETDGITNLLVLTQNDMEVSVEKSKSKLHIQKDETHLRIYVPNVRKDRDLCYYTTLPTRLLSEVLLDDEDSAEDALVTSRAEAILTKILQCPDTIIDDILEDQGVVQVNLDVLRTDNRGPSAVSPSIDLETFSNTDRIETRSTTPLASTRSPSITHTSGTLTPETPVQRPTISAQESSSSRAARAESEPPLNSASSEPFSEVVRAHRSRVTASPSPRSAPDPVRNTAIPRALGNNNEYRRLLDQVIAASRTAEFPSRGAFAFDEMLSALPLDHSSEVSEYPGAFGIRELNELNHDMRIGAAGELFIFEILSRLNPHLVYFGRKNWQSRIRKLVAIHRDYADLEAWSGAETADIVYNDRKGALTNLLFDKGIITEMLWPLNSGPKYYIEVKTTTKECGTKFFMSKSQYQRMRKLQITRGVIAPKEVYLILRVFKLGQGGMGFRVYFDPASMEDEKKLVSTPEKYCVVPGP